MIEWNETTYYYTSNGEYMSLYSFQNPYNVQHQAWTLM